MRSTLLAACLWSASAFQQTSKYHQRVSELKAFEDEVGAQAPLGFFDPLGLVADGDESKFNRLRFVELKHGRISMLAIVGHLVTSGNVRLPGDIDLQGTSFADIPSGLAALDKIPSAGIAQIVAFIGFLELFVMKDVTGTGEFVGTLLFVSLLPISFCTHNALIPYLNTFLWLAGDFRNDFFDLGWDAFSPEEQERKRAIELNQGRAAMMGILALMVHEKLDGNPYIINSLLGYPVDFN